MANTIKDTDVIILNTTMTTIGDLIVQANS